MLSSSVVVLLLLQLLCSLFVSVDCGASRQKKGKCPTLHFDSSFQHSSNAFVSAASSRSSTSKQIEGRSIYWLHIPKTGTSFYNTLLHRCSPALDKDISINTGKFAAVFSNELLSSEPSAFTSCLVPPRIHRPFMPGVSPCPFWVTMIRRPIDRLRSAFLVGGHAYGFNKTQVKPARRAPTLLDFASVPGIQGCQTRMISGVGKCAGLEPTDADAAISILRSEFAFIGITGNWTKSVCLFHAMYGGEVFDIELENSRPKEVRTERNNRLTSREEEAAITDPEDEKVYKFALNWFDEQLKVHKLAVDLCLAKNS